MPGPLCSPTYFSTSDRSAPASFRPATPPLPRSPPRLSPPPSPSGVFLSLLCVSPAPWAEPHLELDCICLYLGSLDLGEEWNVKHSDCYFQMAMTRNSAQVKPIPWHRPRAEGLQGPGVGCFGEFGCFPLHLQALLCLLRRKGEKATKLAASSS